MSKLFNRGSWVVKAGLGLSALLFVVACQSGDTTEEHGVFSQVRSNDATGLSRYLAEGGDPDRINEDGDTLLYVASGAKGGLAVVDALLLAGANTELVSREMRTPLHTAAAWCNDRIVAALLVAGADTKALNSEGNSPIDVVCSQPQNRRDPVIALFLAAGANE